eukprot:TRINITY_DN6297_c1_g2_i1.p2 TRINITY_DN6297_c1_g2~~TRINITY_DN6297_c1_g2_i1.p2  ORF type:complete len:178 (+),score=4.02 TRINITY_DN6297_c1_g2_i1:134-667(+)
MTSSNKTVLNFNIHYKCLQRMKIFYLSSLPTLKSSSAQVISNQPSGLKIDNNKSQFFFKIPSITNPATKPSQAPPVFQIYILMDGTTQIYKQFLLLLVHNATPFYPDVTIKNQIPVFKHKTMSSKTFSHQCGNQLVILFDDQNQLLIQLISSFFYVLNQFAICFSSFMFGDVQNNFP